MFILKIQKNSCVLNLSETVSPFLATACLNYTRRSTGTIALPEYPRDACEGLLPLQSCLFILQLILDDCLILACGDCWVGREIFSFFIFIRKMKNRKVFIGEVQNRPVPHVSETVSPFLATACLNYA